MYGLGLIGEECDGEFKTYHFDSRGSTVAITDESGVITDTFKYDTYGNEIEHIGESNIIFGYNGRDGVVTDKNTLIYMRARYYSPDMRRFVNADIIAGSISNAITLNRYAYANGNPVSFVDPFGLSADRRNTSVESNINYNQALLVTRFDNEGLKIVGHTQLYFLGDDGVWYYTEFTTSGGDNLKEQKSNAQIYWGTKTPPVYDSKSGKFKDVKGSNFVVLNGNFNTSVALAKQYHTNQNFGRYNFLFHNCCDYTNTLLDVADIDGMNGQILSDGIGLISIPAVREAGLSFATGMDSLTNMLINGLTNAGNSISGKSTLGNIAGDILVGTGQFIDSSTNFVGDFIDTANNFSKNVVDGTERVTAAVTNGIVDAGTAIKNGVVNLWNRIFGK